MVAAVRPKLVPVALGTSHKRDVRTQFAALCYRFRKDKPQVLLITSRERRRWILPKGWPMDGKTAAEGAAMEAWEEAGVEGKTYDTCLGIYSYHKLQDRGAGLPIVVAVFPLHVHAMVDDYPEANERERKWFSPKKAAAKVMEPELAQMLRHFNPRRLTR